MATPNVPGITYTSLYTGATKGQPIDTPTVRNPTKYALDLNLIDAQYKGLSTSLEARANQEEDQPLWKKVLSSAPAKLAAKALQYTSGSEIAYKIPGIGQPLEQGVSKIPGLRTALAVGTNPLTYLTGGVGGAAAAAVGAGVGTALGQGYEHTNLPGAGSGYAPVIGGILGGAAGGIGSARFAASRAAATEANIGLAEAGTLNKGMTLHTNDGETFFARRPGDFTIDDPAITVKQPQQFTHDLATGSYRLNPQASSAIDDVAQARAMNAEGQVSNISWKDASRGNPAYDVAQENTKGLPSLADVSKAVKPAFTTVYRNPAIQLAKGFVNPGNIINPTTLKAGAALGAAGTAISAAGLAGEGPTMAPQQEHKGFWGKVFDAAGAAIAPAVDPYIHAINNVFERLPQPVQDDISTGAHTYQRAVNRFIGPVTAKVDEAAKALTGNTIDPLVYALLPNKVANPITDAIDMAAGFAPYVAIGILSGGSAVPAEIGTAVSVAMTTTFAAQGLASASANWEAYKQGELTTGQFLSASGMDLTMVLGARHLPHATRGLAEARQVARIQEAFKDNPAVLRDTMIAGADRHVARIEPSLSPEQHAATVTLYKEALQKSFEPAIAAAVQAPPRALAAEGQVTPDELAAFRENPPTIPTRPLNPARELGNLGEQRPRLADEQALQGIEPSPLTPAELPTGLRSEGQVTGVDQFFAVAVENTKRGGSTFDPNTGTETPMRDRWMVGSDTPGQQVPLDQFNAQHLADYVASNQDFKDPRVNVGTEIVAEDGNHHPLPVDKGGKLFVNIDAVIPVNSQAEAEALAATIPGGHTHPPMNERAPGEGGFKNAQGETATQPTALGAEGQVVPSEIHMVAKNDVFPSPDNPEEMAGKTSGPGRDIGKHEADGQIVGYPEGVVDQAGVDKMRNTMKKYAQDGKEYRFWYEESSHAIIKSMFGVDLGDPKAPDFTQKVQEFASTHDMSQADKFAQYLAILSAQRKVPINTNLALRAWLQKATGTELHNLNLPDQYAKLEQAYAGGDWGNRKTNRFYLALLKNIDPAKYAQMTNGESTIDIWMMRALGYTKDVPTDAQYIAAAREVERLAQETGWTGDQTQAAIWVGGKMGMEGISGEEARFHFGHGIEAQTAQLSLKPGRNANIAVPADASSEVLADYNQKVSAAIGHDVFIETGVLVPDGFTAEGQVTAVAAAPIGPGGKTARPMVEEHTKGLLQGVTAFLAKMTGADEATWAAGIALDKHKWAHNGMGVETSRPITADEARAIEDNLRSQGIDARVELTKTGAWVLNQSKTYDAVDWREVVKESQKPERVGQPTERRTAAATPPEVKAESFEMTQLKKRIDKGTASPEEQARYNDLTSKREKFGYQKATDPKTVRALTAESKEFSAKAAQVIQTTLPDDVHAALFGMRYDGGTVNGNNIEQSIRDSGVPQETWDRLEATVKPRVDAVNQQFAAEHGWELRNEPAPAGGPRGLAAEGEARPLVSNEKIGPRLGELIGVDYKGLSKEELLAYGRQLADEARRDPSIADEMAQVQRALAQRLHDEAARPPTAGAVINNAFRDDIDGWRYYPPEAKTELEKGVYRDAFNNIMKDAEAGAPFENTNEAALVADRAGMDAIKAQVRDDSGLRGSMTYPEGYQTSAGTSEMPVGQMESPWQGPAAEALNARDAAAARRKAEAGPNQAGMTPVTEQAHMRNMAVELRRELDIPRAEMNNWTEQEWNDHQDKVEVLRETIAQLQQARIDRGQGRIFIPEMSDVRIEESKPLLPNATIYDPHNETYYGNGRYAQHENIIKTLGITSGYYGGLRELFSEGYVRLESIPNKEGKPGYDHIELQADTHAHMETAVRNLVDRQGLALETPIYYDISKPGPEEAAGKRTTLDEVYKPLNEGQAAGPPPMDKAAWLTPEGKWLFNKFKRGIHADVLAESGIPGDMKQAIKDGYVRVFEDDRSIAIHAADMAGVQRVLQTLPESSADKTVFWDLRPDKTQDISGYQYVQKGIENGKMKPEMAFKEVGKGTVKDLLPPPEKPTVEPAPTVKLDPNDEVAYRDWSAAKSEAQAYEMVANDSEAKPENRAWAKEQLDLAQTRERVLRNQRFGAEGQVEPAPGGFGNLAEEQAAAAIHAAQNPEFMRAKSYNLMEGGKTREEIVVAESKPHLEALDNATRAVADKPLASRTAEHGPVLDELQSMPAVRDWVRISDQTLEAAKTSLERLGLLLPDMRSIKYGGIVLSREKFVEEGTTKMWRESATFNTDGKRRQVIVNDPLQILQVAKQESALAEAAGNSYNVRDAFAERAANNAFHEPVHALILGHEGDFASVLDQLRQTPEFTAAVEQYGKLYDNWEQSGQLEQLGKVANNADRIDNRQPSPINERPAMGELLQRPVEARNNQPQAAERTGDIGLRRPVNEAGQGLEAGVRPSVPVTGEVRGTGRPTATAAVGEGRRAEVGRNRVGAEGTTTVRRPVKLVSNAAYDVIPRYKNYVAKTTVKEAGAGLEFLKGAEEAKKDTFTPALPDMKQVMATEFVQNWLHKAGIKAGEAGGWKKLIAEVVGGKAATAGTEYEKAIAAYRIIRAAGDSRKYLTMNWLHQAKSPFAEIVGSDGMKTGRLEIEKANGEKVSAFLSDVLSNPSQYKLTDGQKAFVDITHRIIDDHVAELRANGVNIHELGIEKRGEHWFPRFVKGQGGFEFDTPYAKNALGAKQIFEKGRYYNSVAEGTAAGNTYAHPLEALEGFVDAANKTIAAHKFLDAVKQYGVTGRELALEHVGYVERERYNPKTGQKEMVKTFAPLKAASDAVRRTRAEVRQMTRELAAAKRGKRDTAIRTEAKMSIADLNKKVNALDSVKTLRDKLADAKTDKQKAKLGDQLKTLLVSERGKIRRADVKSNERVQAKAAKIEVAQAALDAAKEKDAAARLNLRKTSSDMSAIVKQKAAGRVTETRLLPQEMVDALGLAGDVRVKGVANVPALNGRLFPESVADAISEGLSDKGFGHAFEAIRNINDFARLSKASTDFGYLFIQGLPVLTRHPIAFGKAMVQSLKVFASPEGYAKWLASKKHVTDDMYPYAGGFTGSEYFTATKGNKMKQWADMQITRENPASIGKAALGKGMQRFALSFESFLDAAKISMWEGMMPHLKTVEQKVAYGRLVRNLSGTTDTARLGVSKGAREIEGLLGFSPRFTRSVWALVVQAATKGPMQHEAILSLGALLGGAAIIYAGAKTALGQPVEPADFDPTSGGRFMSVKVGNNWYGLGGSVRGVVQFLGYTVAALHKPERFISTDSTSNDKSNPFLKYARGRLSPFASQVADLAAGSTVIGQDTEDRGAWLRRLPDSFIPFGVQTLAETSGGTEDKVGGFLANMGGLRTYPEAANEDLNQSVRDFANDKSVSGWRDLTSTQKVQMLEAHPELQKQLDKADMSNWTAYKKVALDAANAKKDLAAEWLKTQGTTGGEKVTASDVTSKDYRDRLDNINQRLIGARAALNGANSITGLGGADFNANAATPRQRLMNDYYAAVDKNKFMLPDGSVDWEAKDALANSFISQLSPAQKKIVEEETAGTSLDPLERRLKEARSEFKPYWDLRDSVAQKLGFASALEVTQAPQLRQTTYNKRLQIAQDQFRRANPEIDAKLKLWGYTSKTEQEKAATANHGGLYSTTGKGSLYKVKTPTSSGSLYSTSGKHSLY